MTSCCSPPHARCRLALVVLMVLALATQLLLGAAGSLPGLREIIYGSEEAANMENLEQYRLNINPLPWAFSIWGLIYIWQVVLVGYILSTVCRVGGPGEGRLYVTPVLFCPAFYIMYSLSHVGGATWILVSAREMMDVGFGVIVPMWLCTVVPLALSVVALGRNESVLRKCGLAKDIWMVRIMVHNGLGIYAGWMSIAWILNLGIIMTHPPWGSVDMQVTCMVCLSVLAAELLTWGALDMLLFHRYTNYLVMPYLVPIWALTSSLIGQMQHHGQEGMEFIYTAVLLGVAILLAILKITLMFVRHFRSGSKSVSISTEKLPVA